MNERKIVKLGELLKDFLGPDKTIIVHETKRLTAIGENYGSLMLAVKIHVKNGKLDETVEAVAKIPPPGEFIQRMFNIPVTFRNEINFYKVIVPELTKVLEERNIGSKYLDCFPEYYGARISLADKIYADDDAVLLLENLKIQNYEVVDRTLGFDLETSKIVLKALAKFHAVPIALKLLKPEAFRTRIASLLTPFKVFEMDEKMNAAVKEKLQKIVEGLDDCKEHVSKVLETLRSSDQFWTESKNSPNFVREPFATLIHTDAWVNNFMVQFRDGVPLKCKIVDFQLYEYGSPARDVIFFIYTSIQIPVILQHYEELLDLYHGTFTEILQKLNCDISPFSKDKFREEINIVSKQCEFAHCMVMLEPIFATKDSLKELDQYEEKDMTQLKKIPQQHKERASFIVNEFIRKKLI